MSREELKQILMDLNIHSQPTNDDFEIEVVESLVENVLDGRLELLYSGGLVSYKTTEKGEKYVEEMGK